MSYLKMSQRFIRRLKSYFPMILVSLVISLLLNVYLLGINASGKHGSRSSSFSKKGRTLYDIDQGEGSSSNVDSDVIDEQEDDSSQEMQNIDEFNNVNVLESPGPPRKFVDPSFQPRDCPRTFFKSGPRRARHVRENFENSRKFQEITNITSFIPLHPLSKVRQFLQTEHDKKMEYFCYNIRKFEERNNVSVKSFPQKIRYKLSLHILQTMDYQLKLPGAIIIGVKKGGTTALKFFLDCHPQLKTVRRELDFFSDTRKYKAGLDFYRSKFDFANSNQINMEKSPRYFINKLVPQRIVESLGSSVRLILCVRNPVNRTISDFRHTSFLRLKMKDIKFRTAKTEGDRFFRALFDDNGRVRSGNEFIIPSLYSIHVKEWLKYFSMDQILIVQEEDIRRDLLKVLRETESFLQIEPFFQPSMFQHDQRTCFIHEDTKKCSPRWGSELPKPRVNETVKQKLLEFFRPFNREFEEAVGQTFPWTNW